MDLETYQRHGLHKPFGDDDFFRETVNGRSNREVVKALATPSDDQYSLCPEAYPDEQVPRGSVTSLSEWCDSRIYPKTRRDMWIYTPPQFDPGHEPPALVVFNDGNLYLDESGHIRATKVLDSLTRAGEMRPTIGVFITPGRPDDVARGTESITDTRIIRQRSIEYDNCTDTYARFLVEEVLPVVVHHIGVDLTEDPTRRTIGGTSSGGICAFNAAWHRPDAFGRVLSHCGSFINIRGGHNYPYLVRSTPRKPIRVFLQSGEEDASLINGSLPLANQQMAAALEFAGYEFKFVFGQGGHSLRHGGAIFADSLRWLWR